MNRRIANTRLGVSLTELLILMSSYTMILSLCSVLLHRVMRVEIDSRSFADTERTSERLGNQFRQDIHQATAIEADSAILKNDIFLQLQLPKSQTVEYSRTNGNVLRTASSNGKVSAREEFAFDPSSKLVLRQEESPKRVVLSITSPPLELTSDAAEQLQSYMAVPVGLYVEASLSRDAPSIEAVVGKDGAR